MGNGLSIEIDPMSTQFWNFREQKIPNPLQRRGYEFKIILRKGYVTPAWLRQG
jgi:hypothetical protein